MGKIRVSTIGSEEENLARQKKKEKLEQKKKREESGNQKVHLKSQKGGQKVKSVGAESEAEIEKMVALAHEVDRDQTEGIKVDGDKKAKKKKEKKRGKKYQEALMKIDHNKQYPIDEAVVLLKEVSFSKFDPTVELHINTTEKGLRGTVTLPHGTGKKLRIAIADEENVDKLVKEISEGKINFDALVAHPKAVAKLARVAKFLGPRGLMPNPKNGTISTEPQKVAKKLEGGEINWKTEADFPIIHQRMGKLSFKDKQLVENYEAFVKSITTLKIQKITLKSSMSPAIKIKFS